MSIGTKEHGEIMAAFEQYAKRSPMLVRFDKEPKEEWSKGRIYQDGRTNDMFNTYASGYANARCVYLT